MTCRLNVVCCEMQKQTVRAAHGFEQIKEHFHGVLSENIRIKQWHAVVASEESNRDVVKEFAALSLVETTAFQTDFHRVQFHLADDTLESQHEPIVGIIGIEESIFVRNERAKDGADFKQVAPVFGVPRQATHLQAQHDADLLLSDEFQKSAKSCSRGFAAAADSQIFVDDDDSVIGPSKRRKSFGKSILSGGGFLMVAQLLTCRLPNVQDRVPLQVLAGEFG